MGLWVDDLNVVEESNEVNNGSYSWGNVTIMGLGAGRDKNLLTTSSAPAPERQCSAYNGRHLPPGNLVMHKVEITKTKSGLLGMSFIPDDKTTVPAIKGSLKTPVRTKRISAATSLIFPTGRQRPMNGGERYPGKLQ